MQRPQVVGCPGNNEKKEESCVQVCVEELGEGGDHNRS